MFRLRADDLQAVQLASVFTERPAIAASTTTLRSIAPSIPAGGIRSKAESYMHPCGFGVRRTLASSARNVASSCAVGWREVLRQCGLPGAWSPPFGRSGLRPGLQALYKLAVLPVRLVRLHVRRAASVPCFPPGRAHASRGRSRRFWLAVLGVNVIFSSGISSGLRHPIDPPIRLKCPYTLQPLRCTRQVLRQVRQLSAASGEVLVLTTLVCSNMCISTRRILLSCRTPRVQTRSGHHKLKRLLPWCEE